MLEDSYLCEVSIESATVLKKRVWNRILGMDLMNQDSPVIAAGFEFSYYNDVIRYYSIMFETYGGC